MLEKLDVLNEFGEFTGEVVDRDACHINGLWHRAVYAFIIDENNNVLLQKRSSNKKLWPNKWDVPVGGHVDAGEFGIQAIIRECKEELGLEIKENEIKYLVTSISNYQAGNIIDNHYNECYIITKNININELKLQTEEVSEIKYFSRDEILKIINNNYEGLTEKYSAWNFLKKLLENK